MGKRRLRREVYFVLAALALAPALIVCAVLPAKQNRSRPAAAVNTAVTASGNAASGSGLCGTIILDPGHGGPDPGTAGADGVQEKTLNLQIADKLKSCFVKAGYTVIMTRDDDRTICDPGCSTLAQKKDSDLNNRIKIIQQHPQAVFISIHQNYNANPAYTGTQVYYSLNNAGSKTLAGMIRSQVKTDLENGNNRGIQPPGVLRVLLKAETPAVLVECGFMSNPQEEKSLEDSAYQQKLAASIEKATQDFIQQTSYQ